MRSDELAAAALLAELLDREPDAHDRPGEGDGRYDWDLRAKDGTTFAVEVTMHTDPDMLRFWRNGEHYREIPGLGGTYWVAVTTTASRNDLWKRLPKILADHPKELIDTDIENKRWERSDGRQTPVEELLVSLGVRHVHFFPAPARSAIALTTPDAGVIDAEVAVDAAMRELAPNRKKLAAAVDAKERHLFVWIDGPAWRASASMRDSEPPSSAAPDFGTGIDVLWVAAVDRSRRPLTAAVLWRATSGGPWVDWTAKLDRR